MTTAVLSPERSASPDQSCSDTFRANVGQVSKHSSIFFLGTLSTAAAGYLFKVYLARVLGAEALGIYALGMTLVGFLGLFNAVGLPQSAVRFIAAYRATGTWSQVGGFLISSSVLLAGLNIVLAVVVVVVGPMLAVHFYHTPALSAYMWLFALIMIFGVLNTFYGQVLAGLKDVIRRTVITNFVTTPLTIGLSVLLIGRGMGLKGYIAAQLASACIALAIFLYSVARLVPRIAFAGSVRMPRLPSEVVSFSATAFGLGAVEFLIAQSDKVIIGLFINATSVGIYAVAAAMVTFVPILLQSVNQIFSPIIADLHARGERQVLQRMYQTLTKWILALTLPLGIILIAFARPLMGIFGPAFESGWAILAIGTVGQLVNCSVGSVGYLLLMSGHEKRLIKAQAGSAVLMVILNLALVPLWGITGAAIAAAITAVVSNAWNLVQVRSALGLWPYNRSYLRLWPALSASVIAVLLVYGEAGNFPRPWMAAAAAGILAYLVFAAMAPVTGLDTDDRLILQAVLRRMRPGSKLESSSMRVLP